MRNLLTPARYALAATFVATGLLAPAFVQAGPGEAAHAAPARLAITGSVVATPQPTIPTSLFIQVGSQTISVSITSHTRLLRRFNSTSSVSEFSDGDTVDVSGTPNQGGGITASTIVNSSVQVENTDLQGNVVSITPPGTVPTTIVVNNLSALSGSSAPFPNPLPAQMNLPISTGTTITIGGHTTSAASAMGQVNVNDQVVARGVFDRFTNRFDSISNLNDHTSGTPPPAQNVTGTLAATPSSLTPPALLCLQGAVITNNAVTPQALTAPPCPSGQLGVYVTPTTTITRHFGGPAGLDELSVGDSLQVTGALVNGQFTASTIEDASIQLVNAAVTGAVQSLTTSGNLTDVTITVATNGGAQAPVAVGSTVVLPLANSTAPNCTSPSATQFPCTAVTTSAGTTHGYTTGEITAGQTVAANGVYNLQQHQYLYISTANVTGAVTPPTNQVVKGTLAAAPSQLNAPVLLCLQGAVLSSNTITPQISVVSPCPSGQLPVAVTTTTTFSRQFGEASALFELSAGDSLTVTGGLVSAQFVAASVQDTSIHLPHLTGTVQSIAPNGNVTNLTMVVTAYDGGGSSAPVGSQAILPLADAGSPNCASPSNTQYPCTAVTTSAGTTQGYNPGELTIGQTILATGVFNDQLHRFLFITTVAATASATPPPTPTPAPVSPIRLTVSGILSANPSQVTAPVTLCIRSFRLPRNAPAVVSGVCPARQLPVLVTSSTRIVRRYNGASGLDELNRGDSLQISGVLSGGQVTAVVVKDESIQAAYTRFVGTVGFVNPSRRQPSFTVRIQADATGRAPFRVGSVITVDVGSNTQIITSAGTTNNVTALNPGQTVTVLGVYDRRRHSIIDASRVRVH